MNHFHSFLLTAAACAVAPALAANTLPVPGNVAAVANGNDVTVTWDAPAVPGPTMTVESFEAYPSYAIDNIGDWTMVDVDGLNTNGSYDVPGYDYDLMLQVHYNEPYAWQVYSNELFASPKFDPADGDHVLASFASFGGTSDNWAISPRLCGEAQTISFRGTALATYGDIFPETVEILYSTTGNATEDFTLLTSETGLGNGWSNFSYNLPAGATYFALRYITGDGKAYGVAVDQVSFIKEGDGSPELVGFNVYRDGEKLNPKTIFALSHTDKEGAGATHEYHATALYNQGESVLSEKYYNEFNGIDAAEASDIRVITSRGVITVTGAAGQTLTVCGADGRVAASVEAADSTSVSVTTGIYVVTVGKLTVKVAVK